MSASANVYANAIDQAFAGNINWASHTIKVALMSSSYTPNLATDAFWSNISANEITGTGYTAGGATLATMTHTVTAANSFGTTWAASTAFAQGAVLRPPVGNGYLYFAEAGGTSGATQPTWPTVIGATVTDGSVTWSCLGESIVQFSSASPSWTNSTLTASYGVIYDANTGTATTEPLIALINFGGSASSSAATFSITAPTLGWFWLSPA